MFGEFLPFVVWLSVGLGWNDLALRLLVFGMQSISSSEKKRSPQSQITSAGMISLSVFQISDCLSTML